MTRKFEPSRLTMTIETVSGPPFPAENAISVPAWLGDAKNALG
jgi:hypothetical protein